jgi:dTDP-glucose 4,6-dehydratase
MNKGDGTAVRSYLYSADLVIWLLRVLASGKDREVYNVGSSSPVSIKELANKISGNNMLILGINDANKNVFLPSVEKATMELGLQESFTIDEIIYKTKLFYKC